jgi:hypothetical protein
MKKDISKLIKLLDKYSKDYENIKLNNEIGLELDSFFLQKEKPINDLNRINEAFSKIPENHLVVSRLRINIELKNSDKIKHYKNMFVKKYGDLENDENFTNLNGLVYFLSLVPKKMELELLDKIIELGV